MTELVGLGLAASGLLIFFLSFFRCRAGKAFGLTPWLFPWGIFVWGDGLIIGPFWFGVGLVGWVLADLLLLGLLISLFWLVRSLGEVVYWLNEQFASEKRNKPEDLFGYSLVKSEAIYFLYQVFWQVVAVLGLFFSVWLFIRWLN